MNYIHRNNDIITGTDTLQHLYTFKNFPVYMGCTDNQNPEDDEVADMSWWIGRDSGMIQLNPLLPLDVVYADEHGSGTIGTIWNEHHTAFAEFILKQEVNSVLEIGGLHGFLAKECLNHKHLDWTIVEPNPRIDPSIDVEVICGWFDSDFKTNKQYDAVVHSHVLEHVYDPQQFMRDKASFMHNGSKLIFSVPNLKAMLKDRFTNCLNFEHTYYASEDYVLHLLSQHGFSLLSKKYFKDNHSVFYCAKKVSDTQKSLINLYDENLSIFNSFTDYYKKLVSDYNRVINSTTLPVYMFGAHIFSQVLLQFGLDSTKLLCILDNDPHKHNRRLYGTNLIVNSPVVLQDRGRCLVILKAGIYNDEIKKQILSEINPEIIFI